MGEAVLDAVGDLGGPLLCALTALLAFCETAAFLDFFVPGEVGMVIAGAAARRSDTPLVVVVLSGAIGATIGDSVSYTLGRVYGMRLVERWEFTRRRLGPKVERAHGYFAHRGGAAVFFGRFVGALRAVVPFVAGTAGMPIRRFLPWNIAASLAWAGLVISLGYYLGESVAEAIDRLGLWTSLIVVGLVAAVLLVRWWRKRRTSARASADRS